MGFITVGKENSTNIDLYFEQGPRPTQRERGRASHLRPIRLLAAISLVALAFVGCGGGDDGDSTTAASQAPQTDSGQGATIGAHGEGNLGTILVDSQGRTVYLFEKDSGTKSSCFGGCATAWPPIRASGKPTVGSGLNTSLVGTTPRSDGQAQVTYNDHPLYLFAGDQKAGDTNGQGSTEFGGSWFALSSAGDPVTTPSTTSTSGGGVSGY
jgi:predicted lipoprotein with Yx(FWY)xxD motif